MSLVTSTRVAIFCLACAGKPRGPDLAREPIVFDYLPKYPGAKEYGLGKDGAVPAQFAALVESLGKMNAQQGELKLSWDSRLAHLCADLASVLPREQGEPPAADLVDFLAHHYGIVEPAPALLVAEGGTFPSPEVLQQFSELRQVLPNANRIGVGASGSRLVVALLESQLVLDPLPRGAQLNEILHIAGELGPPEPITGIVTWADESMEELAISQQGQRFASALRCGVPGQAQIELLLMGREGIAQPVANFPLWCAESPPTTVRVGPPALETGDIAQVEAKIFALINHERRLRGLQPVSSHAHLARVARRHSQEMARQESLGHLSRDGASPLDRIRAAGLAPLVLRENVARALSPDELHTGVMASPGHRNNLVSDDVSLVGIGVALGRQVGLRRELWLTELFARMP